MIVVNARFLTQKMSGVQRFSERISLELNALRDDMIFVTPDNIINHAAADQLGAVRIGKRTGHLWEQIDLPRYLNSQGTPLLISLCNTAPLIYRRQIATHHDISYIRHPESYSRMFRYAYRILTPLLLKRVISLITVSEFSREEISKYFGFSKEKMIIIPNAVDGRFRVAVNDATAVPYLLAVSSPAAHKNFQRMIMAFLSLHDSDQIQLRIVGDASSNLSSQDLQGLVLNDKRIIFLGRMSDADLVKQYQGATAFIIPSLYEGFGIPPLEAQACDCPVLASDAAAMPEVLHRSALYFDPLSVSDIASAMDLILNEPALRQILKKLGRSNVDRFSWKKSANLISQHIDALLMEEHAFSL